MARAKACAQHRLGQRGEVAAQPALVVRRRAQVQGVGAPEQVTGARRASPSPARAAGGRRGRAPSRPWCRRSCACGRHGTRSPAPHGAPRAVAARSRIAATSPTSCVSTQRTTSAMVRPSSAAATKRGASSLAAVAYQNSPSAVVPSALAASHSSAAARQAAAPLRAAVSGDQVLGRAPVDARRVDAPHLALPRPCPQRVAEEIALDAGGQHGPTPPEDGRDRQARRLPTLGRARPRPGTGPSRPPGPRRRATPGSTPSRRRPGGAPSAPTSSGRRSRRLRPAGRPPGPARRPDQSRDPCRSGQPGQPVRRSDGCEIPATSAPPRASGRTTSVRPATA